MSTNINTNLLKTFILDKIGGDKLAKHEARKIDIADDKFDAADVDENNSLDIDEILEDKDLYSHFASMYTEEENKTEAKDKEKEKEEQSKVSGGQGGAKA